MKRSDFPQNFKFGTATSAYQIEGTQFGTCGPSHWDQFAKEGKTHNSENGDIACAHYEKWEEDLDLIQQAGLDAYRFSISWPRIQPNGSGTPITESMSFYDKIIDGCLERGIEPHVTLYHWDLPLALSEKGGWQVRDTPKRFAEFSQHIGRRFGDRMASVATINEPWCASWLSHYEGGHAPGIKSLSAGAKSLHYILLAHGLSVEALRSENVENIGIALNMEYAQAASEKEQDQKAAQIFDGIYNRWFAEAIFKGQYPADVLENIANEMPQDWAADMEKISAPIDWLGINYYTRNIISDDGTSSFPYYTTSRGDLPATSQGWELYPQGLEFFLDRITKNYNGDIPITVTENGMASHDVIEDGEVNDVMRTTFFQQHLQAVLNARENGANMAGYFAWSLLDNFEWAFGYAERFGLVHVDFETQVRTPKKSYKFFQDFLTK